MRVSYKVIDKRTDDVYEADKYGNIYCADGYEILLKPNGKLAYLYEDSETQECEEYYTYQLEVDGAKIGIDYSERFEKI